MKRQTCLTVLILSFLLLADAEKTSLGDIVSRLYDILEDTSEEDVAERLTAEGQTDETPWLRYNNVYYKFKKHGKTWSEANAFCVTKGATLAVPRTASENNWIQGVARYSEDGSCWWIGAHDQLHDGTWTDTHNHRLTYTSWGAGEPNNVGNKESCAELCTHNPSTSTFGYWNDVDCNIHRWFICQTFTNPGK